ncbi:MAG: hypothetical protein JSS75_08350 [Bacteroidetes bacterium]|nr:hypothetical protein [Bacteroidota bacterium]
MWVLLTVLIGAVSCTNVEDNGGDGPVHSTKFSDSMTISMSVDTAVVWISQPSNDGAYYRIVPVDGLTDSIRILAKLTGMYLRSDTIADKKLVTIAHDTISAFFQYFSPVRIATKRARPVSIVRTGAVESDAVPTVPLFFVDTAIIEVPRTKVIRMLNTITWKPF